MESAIQNFENQNPFAVKSKMVTRNAAVRKPLRGLDNRVRNIPVKSSFKIAKDVKKPALKECFKEPEKVKKEVLQDISELQKCLPEIISYSTTQIPDNVDNIDSDDTENPQLVSCYIRDIYGYMRSLEAAFPIKKFHLQLQPQITGKMRSVLMDWLVQVHLRFHLLQETLYMTASIIDRYLQVEKVERTQLQCVGVTAMFIASKYEEMYAPHISDFVYITDSSSSKSDILKMEKVILKALDFNLSKPLPLHFLRRNSKAGNVDATIHTLAKYLMELSLPEYDLAQHLPSLVAAASLNLSIRLLTDSPAWSETLQFYSGYSEADLLPVVRKLCKVILDSEKNKLQAVRVKYSSSKLFKISNIPQLKSSVVAELAASKK